MERSKEQSVFLKVLSIVGCLAVLLAALLDAKFFATAAYSSWDHIELRMFVDKEILLIPLILILTIGRIIALLSSRPGAARAAQWCWFGLLAIAVIFISMEWWDSYIQRQVASECAAKGESSNGVCFRIYDMKRATLWPGVLTIYMISGMIKRILIIISNKISADPLP